MALNASGPISLAGTTAGQSIEKELGGNGTTQISLNDAAVRALAGVASGAITMPTNFWGKSSSAPYFATLTAASRAAGTGIATDSSGNTYVTGDGGAANTIFVAKYGASGTIQWKYAITSVSNDRPVGIAVDSSGQPVLFFGDNTPLLFKFDTSGTLLWQRTTTGATGNYSGGYVQYAGNPVTVDSSGNVYTAMLVNGISGSYYSLNVTKRNSSGVVQWSVYKQTANSYLPYDRCSGIALDSSGNVIAVSSTEVVGTASAAFIMQLNSSGVKQWGKGLIGNGCSGYYLNSGYYSVATDSSGNSYACGHYRNWDLSTTNAIVTKYDSSGVIVWTRIFSNGSPTWGMSCTVDASGNVYVVAQVYTIGWETSIVKYNSSGTIQWQRTLTGPNSGGQTELWPNQIVMNGANYFNITFAWATTGTTYLGAPVVQFPVDGSKTGTITVGGQAFAYATATFTTATTSGYTALNLPTAVSAFSLGDSAGSKTVGAASALTNAVTSL